MVKILRDATAGIGPQGEAPWTARVRPSKLIPSSTEGWVTGHHRAIERNGKPQFE